MYSFAGNRLYGVRLVLIFLSFVASLLVTTSISTINILRVNFNNGSALEGSNRTHGLESVSFGVWTFCVSRNNSNVDICDFISPCNFSGSGLTLCSGYHFAYDVNILPLSDQGHVDLGTTWTRAFPAHAAGTILLFLFIFVYLKTEPGIFVTGSLFIVYIACLVIDLAFVLSTRSKLVDDSALSAAPQFKFGMAFWITVSIISVSFIEFAISVVERCCRAHRTELGPRRQLAAAAPSPPPRPTSMATTNTATAPLSIRAEGSRSSVLQRCSVFSESSSSAGSQVGSTTSSRRYLLREQTGGTGSEFGGSKLGRLDEVNIPSRPVRAERNATDGSGGSFHCPICLSEGEEVEHVSSLSCGHTFCTECATAMVRDSSRCAVCRQPAGLNDLRRVYLSGSRL